MADNKPYLDENGDLVIPFECADHRFKYWKKEGAPLSEILREAGVPEERWAEFTHEPFEPEPPEPDDEGGETA